MIYYVNDVGGEIDSDDIDVWCLFNYSVFIINKTEGLINYEYLSCNYTDATPPKSYPVAEFFKRYREATPLENVIIEAYKYALEEYDGEQFDAYINNQIRKYKIDQLIKT